MLNDQSKPSSAISGTTPLESKPRADCILVFHLSAKLFPWNGAKGQCFRTHPMGFVDASATAENLDRYAEAPASVAVCAALRKKPVKRFDLWASLRRGTYTN